MSAGTKHLLLLGGGHSHVEVLRRFARRRNDPGLRVTLVAPEPDSLYSGMVPGVVAGHYGPDEARIALAPLAKGANAGLLIDRAVGLDLERRIVHLAGGAVLDFDLLSLNVGSQPDRSVPGAEAHAIAVKPLAQFLSRWETLRSSAQRGELGSFAVVGGGAGGVEVLLAMQHRLRGSRTSFALVSDAPRLLPGHAAAAARRLQHLFARRGIRLHLGSAAVAVEPGAVVLASGERVAADSLLWVTRAAPLPWLVASGLASDAAGFVRVERTLRSVSHPFVFASGDCASPAEPPLPKAGTYAVRQGPVLAANLLRALEGRRLEAARLPRVTLALIGTGDPSALLSWGPLVAQGRWAWRLKQRIDRAHIARYDLAGDPGSASVPRAD